MDWQPIETAPKSVRILLFCGRVHGGIRTGCWFVNEHYIDDEVSFNGSGWMMDGFDHPFNCAPFAPTHWMPLPASPAS